ncbi:endonuclease/exonuclease/phosphatase family protein [Jiulongibacter sediminis]|uniref:endonuclease/exonuclease/phosphatase family protein n=1 Tax=Jiulongibacter sediminis TaxID=1605367 RepID=UPI0026F132A4|nr:endonuclease/exonuclease/phosphatase family protein [Jiulongibacter sediminis]
MSSNLYKVFLLFFLVLRIGFAQSESNRTIRVLTFNIFHGATMKGDFDLDRIASVINSVQPDLVALQEVDHLTNRSKKYNLMNELAIRTNLSPLFARAMEFDGGEYGEGILSKFTFISSRNVALPSPNEKEPRAAIEVVFRINKTDTIAFVGTHLDHTSEEVRLSQVEEINKAFLPNKYPTILAGDLNAVPGSESIHLLEKQWKTFYDPENYEITFPHLSNPEEALKLDYIMAMPKQQWKELERRVIKDDIASDHYALLSVLELIDP